MYIFPGGQNAKTQPLAQLDINQFTARFFLGNCSILIGTNSNANGTKCLAMEINGKSVSAIPWEMEGMPFRLTDHRFLVISMKGKPVMRTFEINGTSIFEKSQINLPYHMKSDSWLFRARILPDEREWVVIPVLINGREGLVFERLPE